PESITERHARPGYADIESKIDLVEPLGPDTMVYFGIGDASLCACGGPACSMMPPFITTTRSDMVIASTWSWVT
ncbi:hypothetical protein ACCS53_38135, partial [Rhizobium ruizarguesonis]